MGSHILHERRVYGLPRATYVVLVFAGNVSMGDPGAFWLISPKLHRLET